MTLAEALAARVPGATAAEEFGDPVLTVPSALWAGAVGAAVEAGLDYLDVLTGVDEGDRLGVVTYLWSIEARAGVLLTTSVPTADPVLASITPLLPGADWHERETAEMFGVVFAGHPNPGPLLLPDPMPPGLRHPLRKDVVLARRAQPWPGTFDPMRDPA